MANGRDAAGTQTVFCRDCGAEIRENATVCPECGVRQRHPTATRDRGLTDQYSVGVWIGAIVVAVLTLPIGLLIPAYFYIKASNGTGAEQGGWEVWTVILVGIFGIIAVELGGEKGAKILWGIIAAFILFAFLFVLTGAVVRGGDAPVHPRLALLFVFAAAG